MSSNEPDFIDFYNRLQIHYQVLNHFNINYGLETIGASISTELIDSIVHVILNKNLDGLSLEFSWDFAAQTSKYENAFPLDRTGTINVQAYKGIDTYGDYINQALAYHKALFKTTSYESQWNEWYPGSNEEMSLVDGKVGSLDFRDGNWQGFWGKDIEILIDLGKLTEINSISTNFYQYANSWILAPKGVLIEYAKTESDWKTFYEESRTQVDLTNEKKIITYTSDNTETIEARYVKLTAINVGKIPARHEAAGAESWLFIDEIIVK